MSELFNLAKSITRAYASTIVKNTGCSACDELPSNEMCLDCKIADADHDVLRAMNRLEELQKLKQRKEKQNELDCETRTANGAD